MDYRIYNPTVTHQTVIDTYSDPSGLTFVGTAAIVKFKGRYFAAVEGNDGVSEGDPGQMVWMKDSTDLATWSAAYHPFTDAAHCTNPVTEPSYSREFQPCFTIVGNELWCAWDATNWAYLSKLTDPNGKWTNYRIVFDSNDDYKPSLSLDLTTEGPDDNGITPWPIFEDGAQCVCFVASDGVTLADGRIALPVTFASDNDTATPGIANGFTASIKYNAVLFFDGDEWTMSRVDTSLFGDFCAWEPFIVESPSGAIFVYSRTLNMSGTDDQQLLVAWSFDGGATFTNSVPANMRVANSRGSAKKTGSRRWILSHCDNRIHSTNAIEQNSVSGRKNVSLFMSRRGALDFIPGVNVSGDDLYTNYPQFYLDEDKLLVAYTPGIGGTGGIRPSLRIATVTPLPDDTYAYIHPRSNARFDPLTPIDPELIDAVPPYYQFIGGSEAISTTTVTASTGLTFAAWVDWAADSDVIMDSRTSGGAFTPTTFGHVLQRKGLSITNVNFFHGVDLHPGARTFLAAAIDNTAQTVTLYVGNGSSSFTTVTGYYHSILFSTRPADGDTITINGVTYTFRTSPTLTNDVAIGAAVSNTTANLATKLGTASMQAADFSPRMVLARTDIATFNVTSGSSAITVESGMPLNGGVVHYGYKATVSTLGGWSGRMYEARIYTSALTLANMKSLYNNLASAFSFPAISGTATAPGTPFLFLDPNNPNPSQFPSIGVAAECEVVDNDTLKVNGEASASVELPYGATQINLKFKLSAAPSGSDRYVIATIGDGTAPARLYIDHANPTKLYLEDALIATLADVTAWNTVTFILSAGKISVGSIERVAAGRPRLFLGNAYPQGLLTASKSVTFDVSVMHATRV